MGRSVVSKSILDALIRKKLENLPQCGSVQALPVAHVVNGFAGVGGGNWHVPGWIGDADNVEICHRAMQEYLAFLGTQFNVPEDRS